MIFIAIIAKATTLAGKANRSKEQSGRLT